MDPMEIKAFCRAVNQACRDGLLSWQQARTLMGQAKHGDLCAAMQGLETIMRR